MLPTEQDSVTPRFTTPGVCRLRTDVDRGPRKGETLTSTREERSDLHMNVSLHLTVCGVLVFFLVASFLYRKFLDDHDDHNIHLTGSSTDSRIINTQVQHAKRIEMLDRLNIYLSIVVVLYLLAIGIMAAYTGWFSTMQL
jgi:hypothetical protein